MLNLFCSSLSKPFNTHLHRWKWRLIVKNSIVYCLFWFGFHNKVRSREHFSPSYEIYFTNSFTANVGNLSKLCSILQPPFSNNGLVLKWGCCSKSPLHQRVFHASRQLFLMNPLRGFILRHSLLFPIRLKYFLYFWYSCEATWRLSIWNLHITNCHIQFYSSASNSTA